MFMMFMRRTRKERRIWWILFDGALRVILNRRFTRNWHWLPSSHVHDRARGDHCAMLQGEAQASKFGFQGCNLPRHWQYCLLHKGEEGDLKAHGRVIAVGVLALHARPGSVHPDLGPASCPRQSR